MTSLQAVTEEQTRRALGVTVEEFEYLRNPSPDHLHDPFYYKDMRELVFHLHKFKQKQKDNPNLLLIVDGDYDTDGIMCSTILTASLSVFGINHRVYIPSMAEGYGLSRKAVDNMKEAYEKGDYKIGIILTADNGIKAFDGIAYAKAQNIPVLVTDHHPGGNKVPEALAIVNPNRKDDLYPFKGNSGGCVIWKAMLAYASMFQKEDQHLIERLIVFAGLANVADVMPILNENRYTVKAAVKITNELRSYKATPETVDYTKIMNTAYEGYNTVFHGLYDLIMLLQERKDLNRKESGKKGKSIPLPDNEELFSWYLSPLLNAPRRVHDTCFEGMIPFLVSDKEVRHFGIKTLINLNEKKSKLRDTVLNAMEERENVNPEKDMVICANTRGGISGLIAGQQANKTDLPSIVFSCYRPDDDTILYDKPPTDAQYISASARSNVLYPLDLIIERINTQQPNLVSGGGHNVAAGLKIDAKDFITFKQIFYEVLPEVHEEVLRRAIIQPVPENVITLNILTPRQIIVKYPVLDEDEILLVEQNLDTQLFAHSIFETIKFQDSLRPFGKDFNGKTMFRLEFDNLVCEMDWDPHFWQSKTFKFQLFGVEVLTFDPEWADTVKTAFRKGLNITANAELTTNTFHGKVTPQIILSPITV